MNWVHGTVADFGRQLGLPDLSFDDGGLVQLQLQSGGLLAVEQVQRGTADEVLVYLGRPLGFEGGELLRRALTHAHCSSAQALPVQVAVRGEAPEALLLMLLRLPARDFTLPALEHAVDYLNRWFDGARRV